MLSVVCFIASVPPDCENVEKLMFCVNGITLWCKLCKNCEKLEIRMGIFFTVYWLVVGFIGHSKLCSVLTKMMTFSHYFYNAKFLYTLKQKWN